MKKLLSILVSVVLLISVCTSAVSAQVRTDSTSLSRGGASVVFGAALKESGTYNPQTGAGSWCSNLTSISCTGIPSGLIGSNSVVSRMRTNETWASASPIITHSYRNYSQNGDNRVWGGYYSGYGANMEFYRLATSMTSSSANSGCSVTYRWNP